MRRRRSSNRSGQALVEFALTVPILMLLVVGIIEFGRLMSAYQTITDTAREAARRAVVADAPCEDGDKQDAIIDMIQQRLSSAGLNPVGLENLDSALDCNAEPGSGQPTAAVTLVYGYRMAWLGSMIGWATGDATISLTTETRMRRE